MSETIFGKILTGEIPEALKYMKTIMSMPF